ncbi:nickel ABC transporter permease subunit NikB [Rhodovulum sp. BSW8]|uniref:nickel ABC transporter permease subunit NikB n=1 Tax=Rhodovulum sp. BSW8 TaxID=2259645 RepID=UPI000DE4D4DB|nr:nickel ABC transporter permease subunit NikB [Rhodovulum sp. BSW8]RBO53890.1 nickel ABC transporter permease subunit NikB [Rhodovulum sp. BSW8]
MGKYILGRLFWLGPLLLAVSFIIFAVIRLAPGDPAFAFLRLENIPPTPEALAQARHDLGLDQPLLVQYGHWLAAALQGDFGTSFATKRPVLQDIGHFMPATLQLAGVALAFSLIVSVPLGLWSARFKDRWPDHLVRGMAFLGVSTPNFWLGFLLILTFAVWLKWLPPFGAGSLAHMVLPVLTVSFMSLSINARLLRASMLESANAHHVAWARMRGLSDRQVERRHILRNAILPIVTATGMHLGELIGGALVVESIFAWPGVGRYAVSAIGNKDFPVIQCFTLMMVVVFVLCNLIVDILSAALNPQLRLGEGPDP